MMISNKDIKTAINRQLSKTGIEINSTDVSEGFNRPSFFVQFNSNIRSGDEHQVHRSMMVTIYYFPTDRYDYSIEVLDMEERLGELFDMKLLVQDRLLNVDEFNTFVNDGVLNCTFDLAYYDGREYEVENTIIDEMEKDRDRNEDLIEDGYNPDRPGEPLPDDAPDTGEEFYRKYPVEPMEVLELNKEKE